jgi:hypothetical protein
LVVSGERGRSWKSANWNILRDLSLLLKPLVTNPGLKVLPHYQQKRTWRCCPVKTKWYILLGVPTRHAFEAFVPFIKRASYHSGPQTAGQTICKNDLGRPGQFKKIMST